MGGYILPVHLCDDTCEKSFRDRSIRIDTNKTTEVDRSIFNTYPISKKTEMRFQEIVAGLPIYKDPILKVFACDECRKDLSIEGEQRKGYHVWWKIRDGYTLSELHFHKDCATKLGIIS